MWSRWLTRDRGLNSLVASPSGLFGAYGAANGFGALRRFDLDNFTMTHEHDAGLAEEEVHQYINFDWLTLASSDQPSRTFSNLAADAPLRNEGVADPRDPPQTFSELVFAIGEREDDGTDEVVCFDARTLEVAPARGTQHGAHQSPSYSPTA